MARAVVKKWWRRIKRGLERRCWRKARSLATVAIDDHANGTVKSSTTSIHLETYLSELRVECTAIRGDNLVCPFCVNNRVTPFQTRSSINSPNFFPQLRFRTRSLTVGFFLGSARILAHQAALKNRCLVTPAESSNQMSFTQYASVICPRCATKSLQVRCDPE